MTLVAGPVLLGTDDASRPVYQASFKCDQCTNLSIAQLADQVGTDIAQQFDRGVLVTWYPSSAEGKEFPDVPEHIAETGSEAHACMSIGAHRGAIALARAVVEATAKHHNVTRGNLASKVDELANNGVISVAMKDAAHEIRFAGNEVAHGDLADEPISAEDAQEVVALMDAILTRVYQEPAQVARVRARREERTRT